MDAGAVMARRPPSPPRRCSPRSARRCSSSRPSAPTAPTRTSSRSSTPRSPARRSGPDAAAPEQMVVLETDPTSGPRDRPRPHGHRTSACRTTRTTCSGSASATTTWPTAAATGSSTRSSPGATRPRSRARVRRAPRRRRRPRLRPGAARASSRAPAGRVAPTRAGAARVSPAEGERRRADRWAEILGYLDGTRRRSSASIRTSTGCCRAEPGARGVGPGADGRRLARGVHRLAGAPRHHPRPGQGRHPLPPRRSTRARSRAGGGDDVQDRGARPPVRRREGRRAVRPDRRCRSASWSGSPGATRGRSCRCSGPTTTSPRPT